MTFPYWPFQDVYTWVGIRKKRQRERLLQTCMHTLTYSHSGGLPHEYISMPIRIHVNVFVFFLFKKKNCFLWKKKLCKRVNDEQQTASGEPHPVPCACLHPHLPLHPVLVQKIRVWAETLISVKILISNLFLLFGLHPQLPLMLYANPTSCSRLQTQGFTETLSLAKALIN